MERLLKKSTGIHRLVATLLVSLALWPVAAAAQGSTTTPPAPPPPVPASVTVRPTSFNIRSKGKFTVWIALPSGKSAADIKPETVRISAINSVALASPIAPTADRSIESMNGVIALKLKFDRRALDAACQKAGLKKATSLQLTLTGQLKDGETFQGVGSTHVSRSIWGRMWDWVFGTKDQ
jgi:hypothetical protein